MSSSEEGCAVVEVGTSRLKNLIEVPLYYVSEILQLISFLAETARNQDDAWIEGFYD